MQDATRRDLAELDINDELRAKAERLLTPIFDRVPQPPIINHDAGMDEVMVVWYGPRGEVHLSVATDDEMFFSHDAGYEFNDAVSSDKVAAAVHKAFNKAS